AHRLKIVVPDEAELPDIALVDLVKRAEALLSPSPTVAHPVADFSGRVEVAHRLAVDDGRQGVLRRGARDPQGHSRGHQSRARQTPARPLDHVQIPSQSTVPRDKALKAKGKPGGDNCRPRALSSEVPAYRHSHLARTSGLA